MDLVGQGFPQGHHNSCTAELQDAKGTWSGTALLKKKAPAKPKDDQDDQYRSKLKSFPASKVTKAQIAPAIPKRKPTLTVGK